MTTATRSARPRAPRRRARRGSTATRSWPPDSSSPRRPASASISVRDLGAHLGAIRPPIYRHFRSKEDLMKALLDELIAHEPRRESTAEPDDWRGRLRHLAVATLESSRVPGDRRRGDRAHDARPRRARRDRAHARRLLARRARGRRPRAPLRAPGLAHAVERRGHRPQPQRARAPIRRRLSAWFESPLLVDPAQHPLIASLGPRLRALDDRDLFMLGVESILDSAERTAAAAR